MFVYLLASRRNGTLYVGVTNDLVRRVWEHKQKAVPGFTARYGCDRLMWFEAHESAEAAITREKRIKGWRRAWKVELIEKGNPDWVDFIRRSPRGGEVGPRFRGDDRVGGHAPRHDTARAGAATSGSRTGSASRHPARASSA
ncbi:MAG: GIY-YIG nuclease family protein, partial [Acetobacteraceae bacterium]|nr:GIY-YIG nuclease family protein [Acetobacteraceae bacterium]